MEVPIFATNLPTMASSLLPAGLRVKTPKPDQYHWSHKAVYWSSNGTSQFLVNDYGHKKLIGTS